MFISQRTLGLLHGIYSSPIVDSKNAKEDADTEQEERCSSCQTDSEEEEYDEAEVDYREKLSSAIKYIRKEREENKSSKKESMKKKQSVQGSEKGLAGHQEFKSSTRRGQKN
jgi:hypothetical protein